MKIPQKICKNSTMNVNEFLVVMHSAVSKFNG